MMGSSRRHPPAGPGENACMAILLEAVGALIVVALVIRGAMAFWAD
jgi:hypothetical protein